MLRIRLMMMFAAVQIGCAVPASEDVGSSAAALGETGCSTAGGNPYAGTSTNGTTTSFTQSCLTPLIQDSPDSTYTNGTSCSKQYIFEDAGLSTTTTYTAMIDFVSARTSTNCSRSYKRMGIYTYNGSAWTLLSKSGYIGSWNGSSCVWNLDPNIGGNTSPAQILGVTTVRLVGEVYTTNPAIPGATFHDVVRMSLTKHC